jgi:hypothetical protein
MTRPLGREPQALDAAPSELGRESIGLYPGFHQAGAWFHPGLQKCRPLRGSIPSIAPRPLAFSRSREGTVPFRAL